MQPITPPPSLQYPERPFSEDAFVEQQQEADLSEEELRQLYDQEEIERFLRLFSDYVKEVQLPEIPRQNAPRNQDTSSTPHVIPVEDGEWTAVQEDLSLIPSISNTSSHDSMQYSSRSEEIACLYVAPILPGPRPPIPEFTFGRFRLALERLYLFVLPIYLPFFCNLKKLATWKDPFTSSMYCIIYWTLWWYNLLLPALVGRILFSLVRRKIWLYPSLRELRNHRMEINEADKFGEMMTARMTSSSVVTELWRLFRFANQTMGFTKRKPDKCKERISVDASDSQSTAREDKAAIDYMETSREERDIKKYALFILDEIVDLHERIRNIFIWRKPFSSQRYGLALAILFLTSLLPAEYIAKLIFFGFGFLFWHVSPIIAALPRSAKRRIPSPFSDVPTDAEYAMDLISERVAAGLEVNPGKMGKKDSTSTHLSSSETGQAGSNKTLLGGSSASKRLHPRKGNPVPGKWPPIHPLLTTVLSIAQPRAGTETYTYPCQHSSGPGLITLTHNTLFFTPLMSHNAKLVIPLPAVKGVKKAGMLKGLLLRWTNPADETQEQQEEKFHLVGNRDELFARLIGIEGRRWMKECFARMDLYKKLLAKRDSGFGLLWLAATLGSKSAFRKLPKRSVLTADISQLCDLISQPVEPLALRLSSNLMFGVVRVYKVKQEIFLTDVTNCVSSLKKVVQDLRSIAAQEGQLQMANPIARPSAVTIIPNPQMACVLDYDALVVDWDEYLNSGDTTVASISAVDADDDDFDPNQKKQKRPKTVSKDAAEPEAVRKEAHTLDEHHEHILSASYDLSFNGSLQDAGLDPSIVGGPIFDNFFSDGVEDAGGYGMELGEDLARELGWAISPVKSIRGSERHSDLNFDGMNQMPHVDLDFNFDADDIQMDVDPAPITLGERFGHTPCPEFASKKKINKKGTPSSRVESLNSRGALSPATSFSRQLLSQDNETSQPLRDITTEERNRENQAVPSKKLKRTRLLLDARTELTDEELKIAREKYLQLQRLQRRELLQKKIEKESGRIIEEMIWGGPKGMHARELVNFWQKSVKVQVETRSGVLRLHEEDEYESPVHQRKRRKMNRKFAEDANGLPGEEIIQQEANINMDNDMNWDLANNQDIGMNVDNAGPFRYSSEEPEQARRMSKSGSVISANLGLDPEDFVRIGGSGGSQRSSLFPWDNAWPSSSGGGNDVGPDIGGHPIEPVNINLRSESINSRRESSLAPSQRGSVVGGLIFSPVPMGMGGSQIMGEDFAFDIPEDSQQETQKSDMNFVTLERNSYNFLEYAKMQQQSLPRPDDRLSFDTVAPMNTSTRHVAAAAFYHCLVLATKNLIRLEQPAPYAPFLIAIK